jgi:WD40 repeat protein
LSGFAYLAATQNPPDAKGKPDASVSYFKDIRPILQRSCQGCHQPATKSGDLILTTYEGFMAGGAKGKVIVPGDADRSPVMGYLKGDIKPQMPFGSTPLPDAQLDLFRRWIKEGARDDTPAMAKENLAPGKPPVYHAAPVITALAYSPDGETLAVSGYREILLHKADGSELMARLAGLSDKITSLAFSADGSTLAAVGGTAATFGEIQFWDVAARKLKRSVTLTNDTLFGVSFSPDSTKIACGGADNAIYVYEVATGKQLLKMNHHDGWVFGTVFSKDGSQIVSVSRDRAAKLTNVAEGIFIENINQLKGELVTIASQPKQDNVLVGGEDGVPALYMMHRPRSLVIGDTSTLIREFEKQDGPVIAVAFSPDGQLTAVGSSAEEIRIYKTDSGERVQSFKGHQGGIYAVVFKPNGEQLAAAGFDGTVRIYDVKSGQLAKAFVPVPLENQVASKLK